MNHYEGDNFGSLAKLEMTKHFNFSGFNPAVFAQGGWTNVPFREQTGQLQEETEDSPNGIIYTYTISILVANMRDELDDVIRAYLGQVAVIRATDMNGRVYIIGAPCAPVTLTSAGDTGKNYTSENGTVLSIKHQQYHPALRA